jgi:hypothetical protein
MSNSSQSDEETEPLSGEAFAPDSLDVKGAVKCELYVELGIAFPSHCSVSEELSEFETADLFVVGGDCLTKVNCGTTPHDGIYTVKQETCSDCVCTQFNKYDCPPEIKEVEQKQCIVSCHLSDREQLQRLIADLKEVSERVRLLRIVEIEQRDEGEEARSLTFDLTTLTETQRETIEAAVTHGYYEEPKDISLQQLADTLDISKSALSRRLKRAEANIVSQLVRDE